MTEYSAESARKISGQIKVWQSEIAEREEAIKNAKATLAEWYENGTTQEGRFEINRYPYKAFNAAAAKQVLTPAEWERVKVETTTAAKVKAEFGEDSPQYKNSQKASGAIVLTVEIKDVEN